MGKHSDTELACKLWKPILRTPYSDTLVENEQCFHMKTGKFMIYKHAINRNKDDEKMFHTSQNINKQRTNGGKLLSANRNKYACKNCF